MASINYGELAKEAAKGFEPVPDGNYEAEVTGATHKVSSNQNLYYKIEFTLSSGPHKGRKVWYNNTLTAANYGRFFGVMSSLGLDAAFMAAVPEVDGEAYICQQLLGRRALLTLVKGEPYNGKTGNDVKSIGSLGGAAPGVPDVAAPAAAAAAPVPDVAPPAPVAAAPASVGLPPGI